MRITVYNYNVSHVIHHLAFGNSFQRQANPLDSFRHIAQLLYTRLLEAHPRCRQVAATAAWPREKGGHRLRTFLRGARPQCQPAAANAA